MGLTWAPQTVKFNSNKARWGVSIIETPTLSGIQSEWRYWLPFFGGGERNQSHL